MSPLIMLIFFFLNRDENEIVPQVVKAILSIPPTAHLSIRYTSVKLFGELSEWAEKHPEFLGEWWDERKVSGKGGIS